MINFTRKGEKMKKNIFIFFALMFVSSFGYGASISSVIAERAENFVGLSSKNEIGRGRLSCAVMVSKIIPDKQVASPSTAEMFKKMSNSKKWKKIPLSQAREGDIIISPTQKRRGHVGIIGDGVIFQNSSKKKKFVKTDITVKDWVNKYSKRSLKTYVFRYC
jgi:hypothetical protein